MDRADLLARFRAEASERVDAIVQGLLALERESAPPGTIDAIFREAHSIKGGAGMMGLDEVSRLAHAIEDVLAGARERGSLRADEVGPLLRESDRLRAAIPTVPENREAAPGATPAAEPPADAMRPDPLPRSVRVPAAKVDRLLGAAGEAALHHRRIDHLVRRGGVDAIDDATEDELDRGRVLVEELQESVIELRMLPLDSITGPFPRAVRDIAAAEGKDVELVIEGGATQLDRAVLSAVSDPLTHLLRNAVAHGIESPGERENAGKAPRGRIELRAEQRGERVVLEVADDGRGVAPELLRRGEGEPLLEVLAESGLSTAQAVTGISGRGVGLDAVRRSVEEVGGAIDARSAPGKGTRIILELPVSLALVRALVAERAGAVFALPLEAVDHVAMADARMTLAGRMSLEVMGASVPLADLAEALGGAPAAPAVRAPAIVLSAGSDRAALLSDRVIGEEELLVRGLGPLLGGIPGYDGCALLGDGRVALLVDAGFLVRAAAGMTARAPAREERLAPKVLVVDDQFTVRELQRSILEAAGYRVVTAGNGVEAHAQLAAEADVDLVVTDIEMPEMDGFELLAGIRADASRASLPVVVVSSRGSEEDQRRGLEAGADAYIGKDRFDQEALLGAVARLVGR